MNRQHLLNRLELAENAAEDRGDSAAALELGRIRRLWIRGRIDSATAEAAIVGVGQRMAGRS